MKTYEVIMTFTYKARFTLQANNRMHAQSIIEQNSNMELTRDTMETISADGIDWEIEVRPQKSIISLRTLKS